MCSMLTYCPPIHAPLASGEGQIIVQAFWLVAGSHQNEQPRFLFLRHKKGVDLITLYDLILIGFSFGRRLGTGRFHV